MGSFCLRSQYLFVSDSWRRETGSPSLSLPAVGGASHYTATTTSITLPCYPPVPHSTSYPVSTSHFSITLALPLLPLWLSFSSSHPLPPAPSPTPSIPFFSLSPPFPSPSPLWKAVKRSFCTQHCRWGLRLPHSLLGLSLYSLLQTPPNPPPPLLPSLSLTPYNSIATLTSQPRRVLSLSPSCTGVISLHFRFLIPGHQG